MIQTGLKYTQYKVDDGSFVYKLEPAGIENLITFGTETKAVRGRYAVRQLVSQQMEREKIRRRKGGSSNYIKLSQILWTLSRNLAVPNVGSTKLLGKGKWSWSE
jgi:hypothetical protein